MRLSLLLFLIKRNCCTELEEGRNVLWLLLFLTVSLASLGKYFSFCSLVPNFVITELTRVLWISTKTATAGSTLEISSMVKIVVIKLHPEPPYSGAISIPISYKSVTLQCRKSMYFGMTNYHAVLIPTPFWKSMSTTHWLSFPFCSISLTYGLIWSWANLETKTISMNNKR